MLSVLWPVFCPEISEPGLRSWGCGQWLAFLEVTSYPISWELLVEGEETTAWDHWHEITTSWDGAKVIWPEPQYSQYTTPTVDPLPYAWMLKEKEFPSLSFIHSGFNFSSRYLGAGWESWHTTPRKKPFLWVLWGEGALCSLLHWSWVDCISLREAGGSDIVSNTRLIFLISFS